MNKQDFEGDLQNRLSLLEKSCQPERDLWPGIEIALTREASREEAQSGINAHGQRPRRSLPGQWLAVAATFAFVAVLSWFSVNQPASNQINPDLVAALSAQHEDQKQALLVQFQDQSAVTHNWQEQLQELDQAADAIKAALREDPNNVALLKMLQHVHQQQIDLIETVHAPKWQQI